MTNLRQQRDIVRRLEQTQVKEVPGGISGFSTFYDAGTYTPTYVGGTTAGATTYSLQQGEWIRIGGLVVASGVVVWTAATGTGNARISLPFASKAISFSGSASLSGVTFTNSTPTVEIGSGNIFFQLRSPLTNAAGALVQVEAAGTITFTATYFMP